MVVGSYLPEHEQRSNHENRTVRNGIKKLRRFVIPSSLMNASIGIVAKIAQYNLLQ